ncbi:hypothetical protein HCC61_15745 [Streptomyces sp. HNM0575]|uniref:hypothetical protein n=1 Tax=Streptomyces sp. HNM0575 TaxID=2716338 RepID=UPI00145F5EDA|nr:hypothetical protein [Streptomyces sp. HNM0575]NLU74120.1 hypothetical protein [Streptomyces sp. HNM0575]
MGNLPRAITTAGVALAVGLVAVPSASAVVKEAGRTAAAAKSRASAKKTPAPAESTALKQALASERPATVNVHYVLRDGRVVSEQGPGGSAGVQTWNEPAGTGDLPAGRNQGGGAFGFEAAEQDTGEAS